MYAYTHACIGVDETFFTLLQSYIFINIWLHLSNQTANAFKKQYIDFLKLWKVFYAEIQPEDKNNVYLPVFLIVVESKFTSGTSLNTEALRIDWGFDEIYKYIFVARKNYEKLVHSPRCYSIACDLFSLFSCMCEFSIKYLRVSLFFSTSRFIVEF